MGKQIHPNSLRGVVKNIWFPQNNHERQQFIVEDYKINQEIQKFYGLNVVADVCIERSNGNIFVNIFTPRPGFVAGEGRSKILQLEEKVQKLLKTNVKFNIQEFFRQESSAKLICEQIVQQIEGQTNYKRTVKAIIKTVERSMFVRGINIMVSGRINGASIARRERFKTGSVSRQSFSHKVSLHKAQAYTKYGICGVSVLISLGGR